MAAPMKMGRPTVYDPSFCDVVIAGGAEGKSKAELAYDLDVVRQTLDEWVAIYPDFSNAMERARELSLGWWEVQGRKGIWSKDFNANAYSLQVRNRFSAEWRDKQEVEHGASDPLFALLSRVDGRSRGVPGRITEVKQITVEVNKDEEEEEPKKASGSGG